MKVNDCISKIPSPLKGIVISAWILAIETAAGVVLRHSGLSAAAIMSVYILGVLISALFAPDRINNIIMSFASVIVYNFFFIDPKYTLFAYDQDYPVTFIVMFVISFVVGTLAERLKNTADDAARSSAHTQVLLDTSRMLNKARGRSEVAALTGSQMHKLLDRSVMFEMPEKDSVFRFCYPASSEGMFQAPLEQEAIRWTYQTRKESGAFTEVYSGASGQYFPVSINGYIYGVVGIMTGGAKLSKDNLDMLESVLEESALMLENMRITMEKEEEKLKAKNEQFRANLLRSISHDLRTPLTSISGNASNLLQSGESFDNKTREQMYLDIYDDSVWLDNLVENILAISRVEDGHMNLRITTELLDDVINEAMQHIDRRSKDYNIKIEPSEDLILVQIDVHLIVQVIINIVNNSIKYSPAGSSIVISSWKKKSMAYIKISDDGPGISAEDKPHIFEMFYNGNKKIADSRRSIGLGLSLCQSIVKAHKGAILVTDNDPHGTVITFSVPVREIEINEQQRMQDIDC
ncbi:two-component system, OmpR family, sensor histidine kinase KdpD [Lachnospiraceae bacterium]|nr:two-component system, OmpR family, sensor histidine kinase KdpD [Lachnospiraceae bacterium]